MHLPNLKPMIGSPAKVRKPKPVACRYAVIRRHAAGFKSGSYAGGSLAIFSDETILGVFTDRAASGPVPAGRDLRGNVTSPARAAIAARSAKAQAVDCMAEAKRNAPLSYTFQIVRL